MAKKQNKQVKQETLETILMNCRNSLRGRAQMTDKRDLLLTLVVRASRRLSSATEVSVSIPQYSYQQILI